ncbi:transporter substrate-binding domain-containing protein [Thiothrix litoralis]|jgi:ABC-type amino acid transport substrate-binding protein|uniref:Transporter substrate-binding domain-containing protein n=1 Tax=Thiothrix litoralis TaxID=2891210 RepID=A0ABX7WP96_9GAMM|nr:transporter substrate-binding domain-containing protein [Thiothrix litoralis]QTR45654.1 transporter substrate-binding domain-containing protein [Thiothrix litoralis]
MPKIPQQYLVVLLSIVFVFLPLRSSAEETLQVGIKLSEPWVMYDNDVPLGERRPTGFSIDLWQALAKKLDVKTEWVYFDTTKALVDAAANDQVDAAISAITVTAQRETEVDFSNSMYELGLQIMVSPELQRSNPFTVMLREMGKLFSWQSTLFFLLMLLVTANLRLWTDRYQTTQPCFPAGYLAGIRETLWWSVTMLLTWETPHSRGLARIIDLMWHFIGLILLSILTAVVTSALTAQAVSGTIRSVKDLPGKRVVAVATDSPRIWLEQNGINVKPVDSIEAGIKQVQAGEADALVHDGPRLKYLANQINQKTGRKALAVVPASFNPQNYGIAFPNGSELRESVNRALLTLRESQEGNMSFHEELRAKWIKD